MNKQKNQTFVYLSVMAIIMVIDDHCSSVIGFGTSLFPYNSFYMPLFVFVSGYFYARKGVLVELKNKIKRILIPYLIYSFAMIGVAAVLDRLFKVHWLRELDSQTLITLFLQKPVTNLNGAAWFAIMLFWVSVFYIFIRIFLRENIVCDLILTVVFMAAGIWSLYFFRHYTSGIYSLWFYKTVFYIQFYHYGYMFKSYLEDNIKKCRKLGICAICIFINVILLYFYGKNLEYYSTVTMDHFHSEYLPLITSVTGILFYYEVMSFLSEKIGETKMTDFIHRNTSVIMQVHLLFTSIPNLYIYYRNMHGKVEFPDFPMEEFCNSIWTRYNKSSRLIGFFCGLIGSLIFAYILERISAWVRKKRHDNN